MGDSLGKAVRKVKKRSGVRARGLGETFFRTLNPEPRTLLRWYDSNRRDLPWRSAQGEIPDPYHVWLSEVMLQQTTVTAVIPYYQKFLRRWPTLEKLAKASLDDVLRMWAGLGYYRRARMLHACARKIRDDYGGVFPRSETELLKLPGFGAYTAAAVAAIAFDQRANVVDGNVERVMVRVLAISTPLPKAKIEIRAAAETLLPKKRYGDYAQALMDLGATICTPRNPKCDVCPWKYVCLAKANGIAEKLPRRIKAIKKPLRHAIAFVLRNKKGEVLLRRRLETGLLGGMMEVPSSSWVEGRIPTLTQVLEHAPVVAEWRPLPGMVRHVFSHFELSVSVVVAESGRRAKGIWVAPGKLNNEALPSIMHKILRHGLSVV